MVMTWRIWISAVLLALAGAMLAESAMAEVYVWRDEEGKLHYSDTPAHEDARRVAIESQRTDPAAVRERVSAKREERQQREEDLEAYQQAQAEEEATAAESAQDRRAKCERAREKLASYVQARRLYRVNEDGEREYLDGAQMDKARAAAEAEVAENC